MVDRAAPAGQTGDEFAPWGYPAAPKILRKTAFVVGYDPEKRIPLWVAYNVIRANARLPGLGERAFKPDPELPRDESAWDSDYKGSGYDRGHMAPFASVRRPGDPRPEIESCYFSNICPQRPTLNRKEWRLLEEQVRDWAVKYGEVWVIVGPILGDDARTPSGRVALPTAFYMIVAKQGVGHPDVLAFVMSQDESSEDRQFERFLRSVDEVELLSSLDFLASLPDTVEDRVEAIRLQTVWPIHRR